MSNNEITRRASYGRASPVVGERGSRTRARIVTTALSLFESQGFHGTSVDDIAKAAGVSRATLYQYFESKEQIFVQLLDECGTALMRVVRRIGPLEPSELGFDDLHWWLGEWAWVYDKYATMFVQWANVDSPRTPVRPMISGFLDAYHRRIAGRLASSGVSGLDPTDAAMVMTALVNRFNYFQHTRLMGQRTRLMGQRTAEELIDNLAVVIQLILFPLTPASAFKQLLGGAAPAAQASRRPATAPPVPTGNAEPLAPGRFDNLSPRAAATVRGLLDAGIRCFAERGYHGSSVDDLVAEAGFARGTFYKYFSEKLDLLLALSQEAAKHTIELGGRLRQITLGPDGPEQMRNWLTEFVTFHLRYIGVTRTWLEDAPRDPRLDTIRQLVGQEMWGAYSSVLSQVERTYPLDLDIAGIIFFCLLERLPETLTEAGKSLDETVGLIATVIERGLLNGRPIGRATDRRHA